MMTYEFKGYNWEELAECWGIEVGERPLVKDNNGDNFLMVPESVDIYYHINNTRMLITTDNPEEVLAEKIKSYIHEHISGENKVREDMNRFLEALIKESEGHDYSAPAYKGILAIKDDETFAQWFVYNLEKMWT